MKLFSRGIKECYLTPFGGCVSVDDGSPVKFDLAFFALCLLFLPGSCFGFALFSMLVKTLLPSLGCRTHPAIG